MNKSTIDTPGRLIEQLHCSSRLLHRSRGKAGRLRPEDSVMPAADSAQPEGSDAQLKHPHGQKHCNRQSSRSQIKLLNMLAEGGVIPMKQIVEVFDIRPSSASELVSKLEARGFVSRETDSVDKRVTNISITDEGRKFADEASAGRNERLTTLFAGLTEEEQEQLVTLLQKLNDSMREKIGPLDKDGHGLGHGCGRKHGHGHGHGHGLGHGHHEHHGFGCRHAN
jgi:DNA-binding MarR family transcriptional regulator